MTGNESDLKTWLVKRFHCIREEMAASGMEYTPVPATQREIEELQERAGREFGIELPGAYIAFLSLKNGGGQHAELYGTRSYTMRQRGGGVGATAFIEENLRLRLNFPNSGDLIAYGETDLDHIVLHLKDGKLRLRSKTGGDFFDQFKDFEEVVRFAMTG